MAANEGDNNLVGIGLRVKALEMAFEGLHDRLQQIQATLAGLALGQRYQKT